MDCWEGDELRGIECTGNGREVVGGYWKWIGNERDGMDWDGIGCTGILNGNELRWIGNERIEWKWIRYIGWDILDVLVGCVC